MYGPKDKLGDGGFYHNVPSGLYGSDSTQKQYHQVTYDQSYYNNRYHMNNHQTADIMTNRIEASQMGDGGTYHNDSSGYFPANFVTFSLILATSSSQESVFSLLEVLLDGLFSDVSILL
jgi:hypothetical protein